MSKFKASRLESDYLICQKLNNSFEFKIILHTGHDKESKINDFCVVLNEGQNQFVEIELTNNFHYLSVVKDLIQKEGNINVLQSICSSYATNDKIKQVVISLLGIDNRIQEHFYKHDQMLFIRDIFYVGDARDSNIYLTYKTIVQIYHLSGLLNEDFTLKDDVKLCFIPNYGFIRRKELNNFLEKEIIKSSLSDDVKDFMLLDALNNNTADYVSKK